MANPISGSSIADRINALLAERETHESAIARIDARLASVGAALGDGHGMPPAKRRGRPPLALKAASAGAAPSTGKRRRGRGHFAVSAEESILTYVKDHKNPTTQEINKHFKDEGRSSTADNALTKLVKEKKLVRTPLGEGVRGSYYSIA